MPAIARPTPLKPTSAGSIATTRMTTPIISPVSPPFIHACFICFEREALIVPMTRPVIICMTPSPSARTINVSTSPSRLNGTPNPAILNHGSGNPSHPCSHGIAPKNSPKKIPNRMVDVAAGPRRPVPIWIISLSLYLKRSHRTIASMTAPYPMSPTIIPKMSG